MTETNINKIKEVLTRGVERVIGERHLLNKLKSGKKLRIKHGIDPTGSKIHIGRAISLWKLRAFQDLGHQVVVIIGDFTAQIGDASDKTAARRPLSQAEIEKNMKDYKGQIGKILDLKKVEWRYNSQWLGKLTARDLVTISMNFSAQQLIQRRNFKERWEQGKEIGLHELDYPLFQGYDSVAVRSDLEIGGADQLFNLQVGRKMQEIFKQEPQDIMTFKMLPGLDARKMSTTWGNVVNITDSPDNIYGKIMSMKDELMLDYFELCTSLPLKDISKIKADLAKKRINPREVKAQLAREIVALYHGGNAAQGAEKEFNLVFREKALPSRLPAFRLPEKPINILDLLIQAKLVSSKSEAKRLVLQKGVKINGQVEDDWQKTISPKKGTVIQSGKRKFLKII